MLEILYALAILQTVVYVFTARRYRDMTTVLRTIEEREEAIRQTCQLSGTGWPDPEQRLAEVQADMAVLMRRVEALEMSPAAQVVIRERIARLVE